MMRQRRTSTILMIALIALISILLLSACKKTDNDIINGTPGDSSINITYSDDTGSESGSGDGSDDSDDADSDNSTADDNDELTTVITDGDVDDENSTQSDQNITDVVIDEGEGEVEEGNGRMIISFLDVGFGESTFVITPQNRSLIIDGGPDQKGPTVVSHVVGNMPDLGYLDAMILTNPSDENAGGLDSVAFNMAQIGGLFDSGQGYLGDHDYLTQSYQGYYVLGGNKGPISFVKQDQSIPVDKTLTIQAIIPYNDGFFNNTDDNSIVLKLMHGDVSVLIMSRCSEACEQAILGRDLKADVLRVGNFGYDTSTSEALLDAVDPQVAIISTGDFIRHKDPPSQDVLDRLDARGIKVYKTYEDGTITLTSDGSTFTIDVQAVEEEPEDDDS